MSASKMAAMAATGFVLVLSAFLPAAAAAGKTIDAELGKEFRLELGQTARLAKGRALLRITKFIDSPCPKGARCFWSGQAVLYELTVDGKISRPGAPDAPYDVTVKGSDYRTFAVFLVEAPESACVRIKGGAGAECLRGLAVRRRSPKLCRSISDARTRGLCLEDLAPELKDDALCREVESPTQYCLYARAKAAGDLGACEGIVLFHWRVRCFKELSTDGGGGPRSCSDLAAEAAKQCRELVAGPDR